MTNGPLVCAVCLEPGRDFRHFYEIGVIAVAECLGFQAEDNFCDRCYSMIEERHANISQPDSVGRSPTVDTMDLGQTQSQPSQQDRRTTLRLSEIPLPISPARNSSTSRSTASSQVSSQLDDTVDRLVGKRPRFNRSELNAIASQSLSLGHVSSSQDISAGAGGKRSSQRQIVTPDVSTHHQTDDSSLEELQIPPMPKGRRMRPGPKQFATGRLELPLSIKTKVLPDDFPRVSAG